MAKQLNSASAQVNMVFTADASQAKAEIASLQKDLSNLTTNSFKDMGVNSQVSKATAEVTRLKAILTDAVGETGKLDLSKFTKGLSQSGMSIGSVANSLNSLGGSGQAAFAKLASSILKAEMPLKQTNNLITEMKNTLVNSARWTIASSAIKMISSGISNAYSYAQDLNKSLTDIRIVSGKSADDMARFAVEANKAAKALNTTTGRYADASLIYYQQGLTESAVKERTDITTKMSNVTGQSAETVSSQLTAVWNNFDDGSKSLEYFADVMVKLGAYTASSSDEISTGLQKFAPIAKTIGLSYEYAASALATLTATTRESADSVGTALKSIFSRLQGLKLGETLDDGTDLNKYSKALAVVGVDIKAANGELKDMDTILDELASKWDTLSNAQKVALANTVGGQQRYTQFMSLMNNWDYMQELVDVSKASGGTLDQQASIYAESWDAATAKVRASLEGLWQNLIDDKFFIGATNALGDLIDKITALSTGLGGLPGILSLVANSLMKTFGPEIATSVNNMVDNFMVASEFGKGKMAGDKMFAANKLVDMTQKDSSLGDTEKYLAVKGYMAQKNMTSAIIQNSDKWSDTQKAQAGGLLDNVIKSTNAAREAGAERDQVTADNEENAKIRTASLNVAKNAQLQDWDKQIASADASIAKAKTPKTKTKYTNQKQKLETEKAKTDSIDTGKWKAMLDQSYADADVKGRTDSFASRIAQRTPDDYSSILKDLQNVLGDTAKDNTYSPEVQDKIRQIRDIIAKNNENDANDLRDLLTGLADTATKSGEKSNEEYKKIAADLGKSNEEIDRNVEEMNTERKTATQKGSKAATADVALEHNINEGSKGLNSLGTLTSTWGDAISSITQMFSGATQAVFGFKGAIDALNNEDLSFGDKFIATLGGITQGTTGAIDAISGIKNTVKDVSGLHLLQGGKGLSQISSLVGGDQGKIGEVLSTLTNWDRNDTNFIGLAEQINQITGASLVASQAQQLLANSAGVANAAFAIQILKFGLIAAAIAAVIAVIYLLIKAQEDSLNSAQKNYEVQSQKLQQLQSSYDSLTEAVNNFKSAASNYSECVAALEELEQGTLEYREAVLAANDAAQELLSTYKGLTFEVTSEGLIKIANEDIEKAQEGLVNEQRVAAAAVNLQQARTDEAELDARIEQEFVNPKQQESLQITQFDNWFERTGKNVLNWLNNFGLTAPNVDPTGMIVDEGATQNWTSDAVKAIVTDILTNGQFSIDDLIDKGNFQNKISKIYGESTYTNSQITELFDRFFGADKKNEIQSYLDDAKALEIAQNQDYQLAAANRFTQEELYGEGADAVPEEVKQKYLGEVGKAYSDAVNEVDVDEEGFTNYLSDFAKAHGYNSTKGSMVYDAEQKTYQFTDASGKAIDDAVYSAAALEEQYKATKVSSNVQNYQPEKQSIDEYWRDQIKGQFPTTEGQTYSDVGKQIYGEDFATDSTENNDVMQMVANLLSKGVGLDKIMGLGLESEELQEFLEYLANGEWSSVEDLVNKITELGGESSNAAPAIEAIINALKEASALEAPSLEKAQSTHASLEPLLDTDLGETITNEEYAAFAAKAEEQGIDPGDYFAQNANGEWARTVLDDDVYEGVINDLMDADYVDLMGATVNNIGQLAHLLEEGHSLESLGRSATERSGVNQENFINDQLALLNAMDYTSTSDEAANQMAGWIEGLKEGSLSADDMNDIAEAVSNVTSEYNDLNEVMAEQQGIYQAAEIAQRTDEIYREADALGVSRDELAEMAQIYKDQYKGLSDIAALEMAKEYYEREKGMSELNDAMEDYNAIAKDGHKLNEKEAKAMNKVYDAVEKITHSKLGNTAKDFLKTAKGAEQLQKALKGTPSEVKKLQDQIQKMNIADELGLSEENKENFLAGGNLTDEMITGPFEGLADELNTIFSTLPKLNAGDLIEGSAEEACNNLFDQLSEGGTKIDSAIEQMAQLGIIVEPTDPYESNSDWGQSGTYVGLHVSHDAESPDIHYEAQTPVSVDSQMKAETSVSGFKFRKADDGTDAGGGSSGGGGSNPKGAKPKTPKAHKKPDTSKRYHSVKQKIQKTKDNQERVSQNKERAFGKEKIKQAEEEIVLQEKKLKYQTEYAKEVQEFLKEDSEALDKYAKEFNSTWAKSFANTPLAEGIHLEINDDGIIENFQEIEDALLAGENKIIDMENAMNGESTVETDLMQRAIDDMREYIERYEETLQLYEEVMNEMWEDADELDKLFLELTNIKVELKVDVTEDKLSFLEYLLGKIEEDAYKVADAMSYLGQSAGASMDKIVAYREGIDEIFRRRFQGVGKEDLLSKFYDGSITLADMVNPETGALDLGFTQDDIDQIREYRDGLIEAMEALNELRTTELDTLTESLDSFNEQLEGQTSVLESHVSILEAYRDIVDLIGTHNISQSKALLQQINNGQMGAVRLQLSESKNVYEALLAQRDEYQKALNEVMDTGNEDAIHEWQKRLADIEETVNDAKDNFLSNFQDALDTAVDILESSVELAADDFDKMLSPLYNSIDALQDAYDRQETVDNDYVQDYEKYYALAKDIRSLDEMLDDTDSIAAKKRLLKLQQEIVEQKAEDVKLSQYDLDVLEKRIELEKARMALEDAEDDKTTVTLNRDSEGNWGYVYSTDEENVREKEQEYEDKLKEYQDLNKDYIDDLQSQIVDFEAETRDALQDIWEDTTLNEAEKLAQTEQIQSTALEHIRALTDQMARATENQASTYDLMVERYASSNAELIDSFDKTRLSELTGYKSTTEVLDSFSTALDAYIVQLTALQKTYDANIGAITADASTEDWLREIITDIAGINAGSVSISENIRTLSKDMSDTFSAGAQAAVTFEETYANSISSMVEENEKFIASLTNMIALLAKLNEANPEWENLWDEFNLHKELITSGEISERDWDEWYKDWANRVDDWAASLEATGSYNESTDVALKDIAGSIALAANSVIAANADSSSNSGASLQAPSVTDNSTTNNVTTNNYYIDGISLSSDSDSAAALGTIVDDATIDASNTEGYDS